MVNYKLSPSLLSADFGIVKKQLEELDNIKNVIEAGANCIVAGSSTFEKDDIGSSAKQFMDIFNEYSNFDI